MRRLVTALICGAVLAFAGWVGYGIYHAGSEVPPPPTQSQTRLSTGHAEGRRVGGKPSWSLDYDRLTTTPDTTLATLENVRHGELYKRGTPFMRIAAQHVVINTLSNNFDVSGPLELVENDGKHRRRLTSVDASYSGELQTLTLKNPAKIDSDGVRATVANATVNFRSGDMNVGRLIGVY